MLFDLPFAPVTFYQSWMRVSEYDPTRGAVFHFDDGGCRICASFAAWSGLERVEVDGVERSRSRNFKKNSVHEFELGGEDYAIDYEVVHIHKGPVHCTLHKNGRPIQRQTLELEDSSAPAVSAPPLSLGFILVFLVLGILVALVGDRTGISRWWLAGGLAAGVFVYYVVLAIIRTSKECKFVIRREDFPE